MNTRSYFIGGPGSIVRNTEQRLTASAAITEQGQGGGQPRDQGRARTPRATIPTSRGCTRARAFITNFVGQGFIEVNRWVQLKDRLPMGTGNPNTDRFDNTCPTPDPAGGRPVAELQLRLPRRQSRGSRDRDRGNTLNWAGYLRDSWQILHQPHDQPRASLRGAAVALREVSPAHHQTR